MTDVTVAQVFNSRNHLLDILASTGYATEDYENYPVQQVGDMFETNNLDMSLLHSSGTKLIVKYYLSSKLNVCSDEVNQYFEGPVPSLTHRDTLLVIVKNEPNETMINALTTLWNASKNFITVIPIRRLQYNILKHVQVPKHVLLTDEQKADLYRTKMIRHDSELSVISRFDPVATLLCMRPGMVCRISRKSKTSMLTDVYRVCI